MSSPQRTRSPTLHGNFPYRATVWCLLGLSFAVRLYRLGDTEFWFDEAATYVFAIKGFLGNLEFARLSPWEHPPLYYWVVGAWMQGSGSTEFAIRFLSLGLGLVVAALLYRLARRELGENVALGVLAGAAFSPFLVTYAQEARNYSLLLIWTLLALESFLAVVRRGRLRDLVWFCLVSLLGMFTHYFFALTFAGQFIFFLLRGRSPVRSARERRAVLQWLGVMLVPGAALVAWAIASPALRTNVLGSLLNNSYAPGWPLRLTQVVKDMAMPESLGTSVSTAARALAVLAWLPVCFGFVYGDRERPNVTEFRRLLAATIVAGIVTVVVVQQGLLGRHLSAMYPAFLLLSVMGIGELYRRGVRRGNLALLLAGAVVVGGLFTQYGSNKGDYGAAAASALRRMVAGDVVVSGQPSSWPIIDYYHRHSDVPIVYFPEKPIFASLDRPETDPEPETLIRFLEPIAGAHRRVWIVTTGGRTDDPGQTMPRRLSETAFAAEAIYQRATSFELFVNGTIEARDPIARADFGSRIRLEAATINAAAFQPGEAILTELQWMAREGIGADELPILKLVDARGQVWAEQRMPPCGGFCLTSDWRAGETVRDRHAVIVPVGTPPGEYRLTLQLFHPPSGGALSVARSGGSASGDTLELATVRVMPDTQAVAGRVEHPVGAAFGTTLVLAGYEGAPPVARAEGSWPVSLVWQVQGPIAGDSAVVFQWFDERGKPAADVVLPIAAGDYPAAAWQRGELIRQRYEVPLPRDTRATRLRIAVGVRGNGGTAGATASLGDVGVAQIARSFYAESGTHPTNATFGEAIALRGYDAETRAKRRVAVTLYWHALETVPANYKVFVHLIGADETVRAQDDGEPAKGLRPTSGWAAGEYLKDEHVIAIGDGVPPGTYRIAVGLYDAASGQRLAAVSDGARQGGDRLIVGSVTVQ